MFQPRHGVYPTMITPYNRDGSIDYGAVRALTAWYHAQDCDGIFAACQSGEIHMLSLDERVQLAAPSGTGKTTFLEKLIPKLKAYGLKIAIVKHDGHRFDIDHEGKDSDRFTKAGADVTGLISSEKAVLMDNRTVDPEEFLKKIDGVDLILTEGCCTGKKTGNRCRYDRKNVWQ